MQKVGDEEVAIEVTLPSIFAMHVQNTLKRRGVAMNEFILELLTRYVPSVVNSATGCKENINTRENTSELETRA